jgi:hypothetical protein
VESNNEEMIHFIIENHPGRLFETFSMIHFIIEYQPGRLVENPKILEYLLTHYLTVSVYLYNKF